MTVDASWDGMLRELHQTWNIMKSDMYQVFKENIVKIDKEMKDSMAFGEAKQNLLSLSQYFTNTPLV
jgi:hypothetical protein